jgi:hypothetical protein
MGCISYRFLSWLAIIILLILWRWRETGQIKSAVRSIEGVLAFSYTYEEDGGERQQ